MSTLPLLFSVRLHWGAPREPLFVKVGVPVTDRDGHEVSRRSTREIVWLYGVSRKVAGGFVFAGVQKHAKQEGVDDAEEQVRSERSERANT